MKAINSLGGSDAIPWKPGFAVKAFITRYSSIHLLLISYVHIKYDNDNSINKETLKPTNRVHYIREPILIRECHYYNDFLNHIKKAF